MRARRRERECVCVHLHRLGHHRAQPPAHTQSHTALDGQSAQQGRGESGWCSDMTSTHGAWRHAGVGVPPLRRCVASCVDVAGRRVGSAVPSCRCNKSGSPNGYKAHFFRAVCWRRVLHQLMGCVETRRGSIPPLRRCVASCVDVAGRRVGSAVSSCRCAS